MTVVLDEFEWAEEMIASCSLGKKPFETMCRVAKYYLGKQYSKKEARKMMDLFLLRCEPGASLPKWSEMMDYALLQAQKYKPIRISSIDLTKPELDRIGTLGTTQIKRLAFTLLCLSKYFDIINTRSEHWVNCPDSEIMKMANINTSIKRQSLMYHKLNELGLIQFSKRVDNTNVRVLFQEDGEVALQVSDFRNLGNQYMMYTGNPDYIKCRTCGIVVRKNNVAVDGYNLVGRPQVNCVKCSNTLRTQKAVNSVMKRGNIHNSNNRSERKNN